MVTRGLGRLFPALLLAGVLLDLPLRVGPALHEHRVPVLLFHQVGPPLRGSDFWSVEPERFRAVLDRLLASGYATLGVGDLVLWLRDGIPPSAAPGRAVVLTFDDGYRSHADLVPGELARRGQRGIFFVPLLDQPDPRFMAPADLRAAAQAGHDVECHARGFSSLLRRPGEAPTAYEGRLRASLEDARADLQALSGKPVTALAWPSGEWDEPLRERAGRAGFALAFTTDYGQVRGGDDPLALPRFMVTRQTTDEALDDFLDAGRSWLWVDLAVESGLALLCAGALIVAGRRRPSSPPGRP